ncbi:MULTISPECIES: FIST N-terminal domain-containing protein [Roseobacteraceae]|uniref:FIST N-terminal domain-containing protein n=1 Tax=Roseobacteraceae TaxID=2854170 RepID=UPI00080A9E94|nr:MULTISPECIES: FIST N-terminal domain-containing protein [Roseobacteraceae]ANT63478.1 FIST signal transduction protein [Salipiger sp. CCB-MM3]MCA0997157.1 FIST C-terminal domain-containing protein [Alloyangia pacifica]NDW02361.1 FIST signal transduction protein [Salipiger sp. PrR002]NDW59402.1 FIST signal transduction protein [Salipiger sp. PrR004]
MAPDGQLPRFIRIAVSHQSEAAAAVTEALAALDLPEICFILAFLPEGLAPDAVAAALDAGSGGVPVFGCTTAGTITPEGYETGALLLLAFPREHFRCASMLISPLKPLEMKAIASEVRSHAARFRRTAGWNRLALIFADGLAKQEEMLVATLEAALGEVPVFGGSAGDNLAFEETFVLHDGQFHSNAAILLLVETDLEFQGLGFDHFLPTERQVVVTHALPEERLVFEINGAPAALEYARIVGCPVDRLSPQVFAENPMLVRQNMNYHVRAIHSVPDSHALSFLGAIDDGLILTLGRGKEIIETLEAELDTRGPEGGPPDFVLGFDCVLRKLEIEQKQLAPAVSEIFRRRRVLGFNTYGEQHCGVHVNQTFVGVAFYDPGRRELA